MDKDRVKEDDCEGTVQIKVNQLKDQKSVDHWFDLQPSDPSQKEWKGRINLNLWWVHSKVGMLRNLISEQEKDISVFEENLAYYEDRLQMLLNPFEGGEMKAVKVKDTSVSVNNTAKHLTASPEKSEFDEMTLAKLVGTVLEREQRWALTFEKTSNSLSIKLGFDETPWYILFQVSMYLSAFMTLL